MSSSRHYHSEAEDRILDLIFDIPGLTVRIFYLALYRIRREKGICVHNTCGQLAIPGRARCLRHQKKVAAAQKKES
jgi:hypothetical protein